MNVYKKHWDTELDLNGMPTLYSGLTKIYFEDFKTAIDESNYEVTKKLISDLVIGYF